MYLQCVVHGCTPNEQNVVRRCTSVTSNDREGFARYMFAALSDNWERGMTLPRLALTCRHSKVRNLEIPPVCVPVQQQVLGLEIPMDKPLLMEKFQS